MHHIFVIIVFCSCFITNIAFTVEGDIKGSQDHPLVSRMPGYIINEYDVKDFDSIDMSAYISGPEGKWDGKRTKIGHVARPGGKPISMAQLTRNYLGAFTKIGAKVLFEDGRSLLARIEKGQAKTYVSMAAYNEGNSYELVIVETKALEQEVVADASALLQGIATAGKVAVYGIFFDTNKAVVKPESTPTLEQIVKLLKQNPTLQLYVVGHTDATGLVQANLKLSSDRAAAVVAALVAHGVSASRLSPTGVGPYCPESSNRTEEGRAKNRRVELVERL
ncbi:MAG: OmpA family protein [Bdellovibrio sp.]|nr:OmpA family protein [Bdellovibrio sp.]